MNFCGQFQCVCDLIMKRIYFEVLPKFIFLFFFSFSFLFHILFFENKDRDKIPKAHLAETVEELKRFNARRKLKGAVQAIAGGIANDPLCGTDTDSGSCHSNNNNKKNIVEKNLK